jgi:dTDP-4-amino-4,6-dideoxygalactose transaminase
MRDLKLPETERAARETLFLPIYPGLSASLQREVVSRLAASLML